VWWDSLFDIVDKLIPGRMERYTSELNDLTVQLDKALKQGNDTFAAVLLKRIKVLRRKLGYEK